MIPERDKEINVDAIADALELEKIMEESDKEYEDFCNSEEGQNIQPKEDVTSVENVLVNANTGSRVVIHGTGLNSKQVNANVRLEEFLSKDIDDVLDIPESINDIEIPKDMLEDSMKTFGIDDADILSFLGIIKEYRSNWKLRFDMDWYTKMPESVKAQINAQCAEVGNSSKATKKMFAQVLLENIIQDAGIDKIGMDLNAEMAKLNSESKEILKSVSDEAITKYATTIDMQRTVFEENMDKAIKAVKEDDPRYQEKVEKLTAIKDAYVQAYTLEGFIDKARKGKLKVKQFDIQKYGRYCNEFLLKYKGDTPFRIMDITVAVPILTRHFKDEFTVEQIAAFIIAFCKYTINMNSKDIVDHTYMSNVVINIMGFDVKPSSQFESSYYYNFSNAVKEAIKAVNNITE